MDARERFRQTMAFGNPDRPPLFEEGIREEVLNSWHSQGLPPGASLAELFTFDRREEIETDLEPSSAFPGWSVSRRGLDAFQRSLDPHDPARLPAGWEARVRAWRTRDHVLMLRVHRGFFLSMGVDGWGRFAKVIQLLIDDPAFVRRALNIQGEFAARLAERILREVDVDAAIFSEPIGGNHGPLISPKMYLAFVLESYQPLLEILQRYGVKTIILRTYANTRALLPAAVEAGFNCLWACECDPRAMDYRSVREQFGRELGLIGGFDTDLLLSDKETIRREMEEKLLPLLSGGGFVPLADGRVREGAPFESYVFYRRLLEKLVTERQA